MKRDELIDALKPLEAACRRHYDEEFFSVLWQNVKDYHINPVAQALLTLARTEKKLPALAQILEQLPQISNETQPLWFINSEEWHFEQKLEKCLEIWDAHLSRPEQVAFWDGLSPRQQWFFAEAVKWKRLGRAAMIGDPFANLGRKPTTEELIVGVKNVRGETVRWPAWYAKKRRDWHPKTLTATAALTAEFEEIKKSLPPAAGDPAAQPAVVTAAPPETKDQPKEPEWGPDSLPF